MKTIQEYYSAAKENYVAHTGDDWLFEFSAEKIARKASDDREIDRRNWRTLASQLCAMFEAEDTAENKAAAAAPRVENSMDRMIREMETSRGGSPAQLREKNWPAFLAARKDGETFRCEDTGTESFTEFTLQAVSKGQYGFTVRPIATTNDELHVNGASDLSDFAAETISSHKWAMIQ